MAAALATGADAAYLGDEAVEALYPAGAGRVLVHEGAGTQPGRAVTAAGGYLLSAPGPSGSGVKHARSFTRAHWSRRPGSSASAAFPASARP